MNYIHHGDCLLFPIKEIQGDEIKTNVIIEGKITGHVHRIEKKKATIYMDERNVMYVLVREPAALTHEEHGRIIVQPGNYRIGRVKEYDPFEKELRNVQD